MTTEKAKNKGVSKEKQKDRYNQDSERQLIYNKRYWEKKLLGKAVTPCKDLTVK